MSHTPTGRTLTTAKIKITTKCNRHCDWCIFANGRNGMNMSAETFHAVLERLAGVPLRQLHINGGEPTVHPGFAVMSRAAKAALSQAVMVLGTNATTLVHHQPTRDVVAECYDEVLIGCDDEHNNYTHVRAVVPWLRAIGKTTVVNSVIESIDADRLAWLDELCASCGAIHVTNHVHHIDVGQPPNTLRGR